jgi:hypothetical protein
MNDLQTSWIIAKTAKDYLPVIANEREQTPRQAMEQRASKAQKEEKRS